MTTAPTPRPSPVRPSPVSAAAPKEPAAPTTRFEIKPREIRDRAPIILFNAVEGWGKTTLGASAPSPLIAMSGNETGYDTLLSHGLVPQVPALVLNTYPDALALVRQLTADPQGIKTFVPDAVGGFEALCREYVCQRDFGGDWSDGGFNSFGKGVDAVGREWRVFLSALEQLRDRQNVQVLMLGHVKTEKFKNPTGTDYDRYASDLDKRVWGLTAKFCDAVLFGRFYESVDVAKSEQKKGSADRKGKAIGEAQRVVVTERRDGFDAKNRFGMPGEVWIKGQPQDMYSEIWEHITGTQENNDAE